MPPQNATRKQARNPSGGAETERLETMAATSAAQKGERFRTAAVMIVRGLLRLILYSFKPATPIRKRRETRAANSAAKRGEGFRTAGGMIGWLLRRPMCKCFKPATPIRKMTAR